MRRQALGAGLAEKISALLIDRDVPSDALAGVFRELGVELLTASSAEQGLALACKASPDLILLNLDLLEAAKNGVAGTDVLDQMITLRAAIDVIALTADPSIESAVASVKRGALDHFAMPLDLADLRRRLRNWVERRTAANSRFDEASLESEAASAGIIARSTAMLEMVDKAIRIGPYFRNALVLGPTGAGKELIAKLLHRKSGRNGPFVVFNCAAVPESLFESELFGHAKGAFTGAAHDCIGIAEHAHGGTLFLDEIGELTPALQTTLLRLVQNRESKRLGTSAARRLDIRIIAATNRNLRKMVEERSFREDLYQRIATIDIQVPALRGRCEDIAALTDHFLAALCNRYGKTRKCFSRQAEEVLRIYSWPGNVRELESVVDYCCLMARSTCIDLDDLPDFLRAEEQAAPTSIASLEEMELRHLLRVLESYNGNRNMAAETLGIGRATLYRMLASAGNPAVTKAASRGRSRASAAGAASSLKPEGLA